MTLGARIAFGVSLVVNAAALYLLSISAPDAGGVPPPVLTEMSPADAASPAQSAGDARGYRDALLARGLTLEETKPLVLAALVAASAAARHAEGADEYWRSGYPASAAASVRERSAAADRVRAQLLDLYGAQARHEAAFACLFAPLDVRYAFLEPEQQLALQKLQLARQVKRAEGAPAAMPAAPGAAEQGVARVSATAEAFAELRTALGAEAALQYLYRFSPLADQLRSAGLDLSDAEFRGAFGALLEFEAKPADPQTFTRARDSLRATLGDVRFNRLWAARDPLFGVLAAAGKQRGLGEDAIVAAYTLFNDAQDRFAAAADRFAALDPPRAAAELRAIQQDMQQRLESLVGQEAADALLHASTRHSISMQSTSTTNLRE
ncbi:MAG TPA: hypothetical protein VHH11_09715 [Gammaproteobacteria bacterium]|nr:hypothetical protein [Gammaproteobacteria bacterium]